MFRTVFVLAAVLSFASRMWAAESPAHGKAKPYLEINRFQLGGDGGWDCLLNDDVGRRLYIARANRVMIVDSDKGTSVAEIAGLEGAHGVALVKSLNRGFASSGKTSEVIVFNLDDHKIIQKIKVGMNPDIMLFDESSGKVLSFNGKSQDVTAIDPQTMKVTGTLALEGKPEFAVADGTGKVFINLEDKSEVAAFDAKTLKLGGKIKLAPCEEPTGLAIDVKTSRLIVGCGNKMAVIVDAKEGRVMQRFAAGEGIDGTAFDSTRNLAYVSAGEGVLTVLEEDAAGFHHVQDVKTVKGARTLTVDTKTGHVFLPMAKYEPAKGKERPQITPGTFAVLVIGQ